MTVLANFIAFARALPAERREAMDDALAALMGTPHLPSCAASGARRRVTGMRFYRKGMGVKCTVTVIVKGWELSALSP